MINITHVSLHQRRLSRGLIKRNRNRPTPPRSVRRRTYRCGRLNPEPRHPYGRGRLDADDLSILSRRSEIDRTVSEFARTISVAFLISKIAASCLNLATASWVGQYFCIVSSSGVTTLTRELSISAANRRYSSQLNRGSAQRGWSGNYWRRTTESCSGMTRSVRKRRRNPEPARSSRTTSLSVRSGW